MIRKIFYTTFLLLLNLLCFGQKLNGLSDFDYAYQEELRAENEALTARIKTFPADVQDFNNKVALAVRNNNLSEALSLTMAIDSMYPNLADVKNFKGKLLIKKGDADAAVNAFNEAIKLNPSNKWFYINAATALAEQGKNKEGLNMIGKLIEKIPNWSIAYNVKAAILHSAGRNQEALLAYTKGISALPKSAQILTNRGDLYLFLKQKKMALKDYHNALKIQPDYQLAKSKLDALE